MHSARFNRVLETPFAEEKSFRTCDKAGFLPLVSALENRRQPPPNPFIPFGSAQGCGRLRMALAIGAPHGRLSFV